MKSSQKIHSGLKMVVKDLNSIHVNTNKENKKLNPKRKISDDSICPKNVKLCKIDFDTNLPGTIRLHKEIVKYVNDILPKPKDYNLRRDVVNRITKVVHSLWPHAKVETFGSYSTGLFLPTSDIDVVVFGHWKKKPLHTLCNALVTSGIVENKNAYVVDKAKIPIVKLVDKQSKLKIDISFNLMNGLISAQLIKDYLNEYPLLLPLVMILKQFLVERGLNEVYRGGVGSYTLILMIVNFLQMHARGEGNMKDVNMGVFLLEFFELYGLTFNYNKTKIKVSDTGQYSKRGAVDRFSLSIMDPICQDNDVASNSYKMFQVQSAFKYAYKTLCNAIADVDSKTDDHPSGIFSTIINVNIQDKNNIQEKSFKKNKKKRLKTTVN